MMLSNVATEAGSLRGSRLIATVHPRDPLFAVHDEVRDDAGHADGDSETQESNELWIHGCIVGRAASRRSTWIGKYCACFGASAFSSSPRARIGIHVP